MANSQHLFGEAADIYVSDAHQCQKYAKIITELTDFDQLILEPIHSEGETLAACEHFTTA